MNKIEEAAFELYAAGPWGELDRFLDGGSACSTKGHTMSIYMEMVKLIAPILTQDTDKGKNSE